MAEATKSWIDEESKRSARRSALVKRWICLLLFLALAYTWIGFVIGIPPFSPRHVVGRSGAVSFLSTPTGRIIGVAYGFLPLWQRGVTTWHDGWYEGFLPALVEPQTGLLILQSQDGDLRALDAKGREAWRFQFSTDGARSADPAVLVTICEESAVGIDAQGKQAWIKERQTSLWFQRVLLPVNDRFYVGTQDFERHKIEVIAYDRHGKQTWSRQLAGDWANSILPGKNGVVFMSTEGSSGKCGIPDSGEIYSFDSEGKLLWQQPRVPMSWHPVMELEGDNLAYKDSSGKVLIISQAGEVIGERDLPWK
jgi:hypothetical protein